MSTQRPQDGAKCGRLFAQMRGRCGRTVIERMGDGYIRIDPLQAMLSKRHGAKSRRCHRERMHRGTNIMHETRQRQLRRSRASADGRLRFEDRDREPSLRERDGCRQPIRSGPDDKRFAPPSRHSQP